MSKIKLTKGELKRQRDSLKQFRQYLPTLQLKKQQLQMKVNEARDEYDALVTEHQEQNKFVKSWSGLLNDAKVDFKHLITPVFIQYQNVNIAGANVPTLEQVIFPDPEYDLYSTPFWTDLALDWLKRLSLTKVRLYLAQKKIDILMKELRTTTQRVNLFEKVKIPECQDNIRRIRIYLGDQQSSAVGISKVAKKKVDARDALLAAQS